MWMKMIVIMKVALSTYGHISAWDVSLITDMSYLFSNKITFNDNISNWDVSNVTNMSNMFYGLNMLSTRIFQIGMYLM